MAVAVTIGFAREFSQQSRSGLMRHSRILVWLITLLVVALLLVELKRYLKEAWLEQGKE